jgi:hypothetical protein
LGARKTAQIGGFFFSFMQATSIGHVPSSIVFLSMVQRTWSMPWPMRALASYRRTNYRFCAMIGAAKIARRCAHS